MAALSKRERYIAFGVGAAVLIFLANQFLWVPYETALDDLHKKSDRVNKQVSEAGDLLKKRRDLQTMVTAMTASGLQSDPTLAESQAINALNDWARDCRVNITAINPERPVQEGAFTAISFHVTAGGPTSAIARFIHAIETSTLPVRISDLTVKSVKEQTDDLQVNMSFSTLCITSDLKKKQQKPGSGGASAANTAGAQ